MYSFNPNPPTQILGGPTGHFCLCQVIADQAEPGGGHAPGDLTFAVDVLSGLLLLHFLHILHVCRVQLSLVFTAERETEKGGSD